MTANEQPDGLLIDLIETIAGIGAVVTGLVLLVGLLFLMVTRAHPGSGGERAAAQARATTPAETSAPSEASEAAPSEEVLALGAEVFAAQGCGACHTLEGVSQGMVGPNLSNLPSVAAERAQAAGVADAEAYVHQSIVEPNAYVVEECPTGPCPMGTMPTNFDRVLSDEEVNAVVQYLLNR